ncbi:uncharacterized protein [Prorops nasuta]|uniref:uncharacterized protein n=1 Tax=Prorops nasuta TaxID=863751 RepID=UPI0034CF2A22
MRTGSIILFNVTCLLMATEILAHGGITNETSTQLKKIRCFEIIPGVKLSLGDDAIWVNVKMRDFFRENEVEGRDDDKRPTILQRIGTFLMMIPLGMQLLSLPGAIAHIKVQLIRSIVVAKMALIMIIFNALKSYEMSEIVMVQPHHHDHYYETPPPSYHVNEDHDQGWINSFK